MEHKISLWCLEQAVCEIYSQNQFNLIYIYSTLSYNKKLL
jgi:hypothetical protein